MNAIRRHQRLLWLLAGWLFIAPILGFQHLYGAHSNIADDVCETCVLSSGGGHAVTPHVSIAPIAVSISQRITATALPTLKASIFRAKARAPPHA